MGISNAERERQIVEAYREVIDQEKFRAYFKRAAEIEEYINNRLITDERGTIKAYCCFKAEIYLDAGGDYPGGQSYFELGVENIEYQETYIRGIHCPLDVTNVEAFKYLSNSLIMKLLPENEQPQFSYYDMKPRNLSKHQISVLMF